MIVKITFVDSRLYVASFDLAPEEHAALRHDPDHRPGLGALIAATGIEGGKWLKTDEIIVRRMRTPISMEPR